MKLLFTSDLHGHTDDYAQFVRLLRDGPYDLGILGGDLLDQWLPPEQVDALLGLDPDASLAAKVAQLQDHLSQAGKPVYFVHNCAGRRGRHVNGSWPTYRKMFAIELSTRGVRRVTE